MCHKLLHYVTANIMSGKITYIVSIFNDAGHSKISGYKYNYHIRFYMVWNMVCLMHQIRGHKTVTGTVTYSNSANNHEGNELNF